MNEARNIWLTHTRLALAALESGGFWLAQAEAKSRHIN
jgi:hypothetical protein